MKQSNKIPLSLIRERLSKAIDYPLGNNHIAVLVHGWMRRHPEQAPDVSTLRKRKNKDGFTWLTHREAIDLAHYAGYKIF